MLVTANQQATISPSQIKASIQRGTERRTAGTIMAAAMPANSATESSTDIEIPIVWETQPRSRVLGAAGMTSGRRAEE